MSFRRSRLLLGVLSAFLLASSGGAATWESIGPDGGIISALAVDPVTPTTIYAGTQSGGVFKSSDNGATWSPANSGLTSRAVRALAVDPATPATLYAATAGGVFRSTNGAGSWSAANSGLTSLSVQSLAVDPGTPTTLYAGTASGGVFKSTNGAASWSATNGGLTNLNVRALAVNPATPATLHAGTAGGVFRSTNGGTSWGAVNSGLTNLNVQALVVNPAVPSTLYAGTFGGSGVFRSTNAGTSWSAANSGLTSSFVQALALDPVTPTTLYAGTSSGGVFKSTNGATSWSASNSGLTNLNVRELAVDPATPARVYLGTDNRGVFRSTNGAASWSAASGGLRNLWIRAFAQDPSTPAILYAATNDGMFKSTNAGVSWSAANSGITGNVATLAPDPGVPTTLYAGTDGSGVFKSTNGGASWSATNSGLTFPVIWVLAVDPVTPTTLYAGTDGGGVFKSTDGGASWSAANSGLTNLFVRALAVDPLTPTTLYVGTDGGARSFKSTDGGASWSAANSGLPVFGVWALALDPGTPGTLYAGTSGGGVYKSTDGGASWGAANAGLADLFVNSLVLDPADPASLHVATDGGGVFASDDGAASWTASNAGLLDLSVPSLAIDPGGSGTLYAGTRVASVFRLARPCANTFDDDGDGLADFPDDPGCSDADDPDEISTALVCDNGEDDDGDDLFDAVEDGGCDGPTGSIENAIHPMGGGHTLGALDIAPSSALEGETVGMLRLDLAHTGRAGDGSLRLSELRLRFQRFLVPLDDAGLAALADSVRLYRDDGDGVFESGSETLVASFPAGSLGLVAGEATLALQPGEPGVGPEDGQSYFVAVSLAAGASGQVDPALSVVHLAAGALVAHADLGTPEPLQPSGDVLAGPLLAATSSSDFDQDGIPDVDESVLHGTSPFLADTDEDEWDDGDEVALGFDPNDFYDQPLALFLGREQTIGTTASGFNATVAVDIDSDLDLDLVSVRREELEEQGLTQDHVTVHYNLSGDGSWWSGAEEIATVPIPCNPDDEGDCRGVTYRPSFADLDGDSDRDLVLGHAWVENDRLSGSWVPHTSIGCGSTALGAVAANPNGGDVDMVFMHNNLLTACVNQGGGSLWTNLVLAVVQPPSELGEVDLRGRILPADVDGNGTQDLVAALARTEYVHGAPDSRIVWWSNPGWSVNLVHASTSRVYTDLHVDDLDDDVNERPDLVAGTEGFEAAVTFLNAAGDGSVWPESGSFGGFGPVSSADLDLDGTPEIVLLNRICYLNPGSCTTIDGPILTGEAGDIDGDGDPDLTWSNGFLDVGWIPNIPRPCADGVDNDGDTFADWPADLDCSSKTDLSESTACELCVVVDETTPQSFLDGLVDVAADLSLVQTDRPDLTLPNLTNVDGTLEVSENSVLQDLLLPLLAQVQNLRIRENNQLHTIDVAHLTSAAEISFRDNPQVTELCLQNLTSVGLLSLNDNEELQELCLSFLKIAFGLDFLHNASLVAVDLPALESVGDMSFSNNDALESVAAPVLGSAGDVSFTDNDSLESVELPALESAQDVEITFNGLLATVELAALSTACNMDFSDNAVLANVTLSSLLTACDLDFSDNPQLAGLDLPLLASAHDVTVQRNGDLLQIDFSSLLTLDHLVVSQNDGLAGIELSGLFDLQSLVVAANESLVDLDLSALTGACDLLVSGNPELAGLDLSTLASACDVEYSANGGTTLDLSGLTDAESLTITDNPELESIALSPELEVTGDVTIETEAMETLDLSDVAVGSDLTVEGTNMDSVSVQTAALDTSIALLHPGAAVQVQLPFGTFVVPATLTVTRQEPSGLVSESGSDGDGGAASVDPIAAYQFAFSIPTPFGVPATLSFIAYLADLSEEEQTELVAGIAAGTASLAVKSDVAGSEYETLALCTGAQTPAGDGCVAAERLDAAGLPLAPESTEIPAAIRFTSVAGHFSTWALVHTERALAAALVATIDDPITLSNPKPVSVVVHGSATVDVSQVAVASLRFGVGQVAALSAHIISGGDPFPDLVATFPVPGSGVALGDTEACVSGLVAGEAFVACDGVLVRLQGRRCGLGYELAPALALLGWLRARRRGRR